MSRVWISNGTLLVVVYPYHCLNGGEKKRSGKIIAQKFPFHLNVIPIINHWGSIYQLVYESLDEGVK